jgi:16S rRNA processing protein RimM
LINGPQLKSSSDPQTPKDSWPIEELIGCGVYDAAGAKLGEIVEVLATGSNDVWVVRSSLADVKEFIVPALRSVVREVSLADRRVVIDIPIGLMDVYKKM